MSRPRLSILFAGLLGMAPTLAQAGVAQELDLSGAWVFTVESPNGTGTRDVVFDQEGDILSGTISSSQAGGDFTGVVDGDQVTFTVVLTMDTGLFSVTYDATVTADEMEGTVDFGDYGQGTFTGERSDPDGTARTT